MLRLFILDDYAPLIRSLAPSLLKHGYASTLSHQPLEALHRLQSEPFDLLLTDYEMPDLTGLQLVAQLRKTSSIPVVLMSGRPFLVDSLYAQQLGIAQILPKPFSLAELAQALQSALAQPSLQSIK